MAYPIDEASARDIAARIERLNFNRSSLPPREVMHQLRAVRIASQAGGLAAVATLAFALESELLACGNEAPIDAYLDRMHDAVDVATDHQQRFVELALATVGTRLALA